MPTEKKSPDSERISENIMPLPVKRNNYLFLFGLLILLVTFNACRPLRHSSDFMLSRFQDARMEMTTFEDRNLRYMVLHRNDTFPTIFFLHGSPSSMAVYNVYFEDPDLAQWANLIAADRPGYGYSDPGRSETSVRRQAEMMWHILEQEGFPSPLYIIGSSYGGTVAAKMAMLKPDKVDGMVLVSASLAPGEEHTYAISHVIRHAPFRWIVPGKIMVANDEKLSHYEALSDMLPYWDRITAPVVLIQGTNDNLIFPENMFFAKRMLSNARFIDYNLLEGEGHFLQIRYREFIIERLRNLIHQKNEDQPLYLQELVY